MKSHEQYITSYNEYLPKLDPDNSIEQIEEIKKNYKQSHDQYMESHKEYIESPTKDETNDENYKQSHEQYMTFYEESLKKLYPQINADNSLTYFGQTLNQPSSTNIEDFKENQGQLNSDFILRHADPSAININNDISESTTLF